MGEAISERCIARTRAEGKAACGGVLEEKTLGRRLMVGQVPFHPTEPKAGSSGIPAVEFGSAEEELLGRRLMVGQVPLEHFV